MSRYIIWFISGLLFLLMAAVVFVSVSPDYNVYLVKGQSMEPAINMGDMVITGPADGLLSREIKPGTIVTYQKANSPVTHRVIAIEGDCLITKGDAAEDPDPVPVMMSEVCGIFLVRIPYLGYFSSFIRTTIGWIVLVMLPTIIVVGFLVYRIIKVSRVISAEHGG